MKTAIRGLFLTAGVGFCASCGGETDGGTAAPSPLMVCARVPAACGGDVVGTWNVTGNCFASDPTPMLAANLPAACKNMFTAIDLTETGTATFRADGTFTKSTIVSGDMTTSMTSACIQAQGGTGADASTCAALQQSYQSQAASDPQGTISGATCSLVSGACECVLLARPQPNTVDATYTTSGSTLRLAQPSGNVEQDDYCVSGTTLTLVSPPDQYGVRQVMTLERS